MLSPPHPIPSVLLASRMHHRLMRCWNNWNNHFGCHNNPSDTEPSSSRSNAGPLLRENWDSAWHIKEWYSLPPMTWFRPFFILFLVGIDWHYSRPVGQRNRDRKKCETYQITHWSLIRSHFLLCYGPLEHYTGDLAFEGVAMGTKIVIKELQLFP